MRQNLCLSLLLMCLGGCTWGIDPTAASKKVHTAWDENVTACHMLGKITVSVFSHLGWLERNDIKVRDELQVMARNEAVSMRADTIKPLSEPHNGEQVWGAYICGTSRAPVSHAGKVATENSGVQTFPLRR